MPRACEGACGSRGRPGEGSANGPAPRPGPAPFLEDWGSRSLFPRGDGETIGRAPARRCPSSKAWGRSKTPAPASRRSGTRACALGLARCPRRRGGDPHFALCSQPLCWKFSSHLTGGKIGVQRGERACLVSHLSVSIRTNRRDEKAAGSWGRQQPSRLCFVAPVPAPVKP